MNRHLVVPAGTRRPGTVLDGPMQRNDVGLLSEEYGTASHRLLGNFPQAFSHVSMIGTARNLSRGVVGPAERRRKLSLSRVRRPAAGAPS